MSSVHRQEFCVRWNSHLGSIGESFPQLLAGQRFVDVTLACEGHQVHCHRLVLAACSSYFESILAENPCKHPVVILPSEIRLWEIQALVDFMYKGEVNVTQAGLPQLLRCAEQLRIKGLYGSDAALNLDQLKALTSKSTGLTTPGLTTIGLNGPETDDTATSSTITTSSTTHNAANVHHHHQLHHQSHAQIGVVPQELLMKKNLVSLQQHTNGMSTAKQENQSHIQQQQQHRQQQQQQQKINLQLHGQQYSGAALIKHERRTAHNNLAPAEDESVDGSTMMSNTYDHYDDEVLATQQQQQQQPAVANLIGQQIGQQSLMLLESTIEDDHNYVVAQPDEDDNSFGDNEHEASTNSSNLHLQQNITLDTSASFKRVRRSEASLAQAAKCVSKGQTFQTVSNLFNIPVSTIRFYMARKGILPKRKRGRGASNSNASLSLNSTPGTSMVEFSGSTHSDTHSPSMPERKRQARVASPVSDGTGIVPSSTPYHLVGYKMGEQSTIV